MTSPRCTDATPNAGSVRCSQRRAAWARFRHCGFRFPAHAASMGANLAPPEQAPPVPVPRPRQAARSRTERRIGAGEASHNPVPTNASTASQIAGSGTRPDAPFGTSGASAGERCSASRLCVVFTDSGAVQGDFDALMSSRQALRLVQLSILDAIDEAANVFLVLDERIDLESPN